MGDSLAVTIPPAWLRQKGLVVGDDVIVIADNELTINKVTKEKVAELHKAMEGKK